jgi:steroid Delta-isomerase
MAEHEQLLRTHTALFNQGVRSGDFGPMLAQFADDAELVFEGIPVGPFKGKPAIDAAYRAQPPTDEIEILCAGEQGGDLVITYAWRGAPTQPAGTMIITPEAGKIARLTIVYGGGQSSGAGGWEQLGV